MGQTRIASYRLRPLRLALLLTGIAVSLGLLSGASRATADPDANTRTKDTLLYLSTVTKRSEHNVITGQYVASAACCSAEEIGQQGVDHNLGQTIKVTGRTPGMIGWDYNDHNVVHPGKPVEYGVLNALIIHYARAGSLTTISYHANNPWTGGAWNDTSCPGKLTDLLDPYNAAGAAWHIQLDRVAAGLQELQDHGITVLWRPFMEMNGPFFWWGSCKPTLSDFSLVWKAMFDDFTKIKGLHNLLWIYGQNGGSEMPLFYPGKEFVDIIGFDDYHDDITFPGYATWLRYEKPLAMTERGPHTTDGSSELFANVLPSIAKNRWKIAYVMGWAGPFGQGYNLGGTAFMNSLNVVNDEGVLKDMTCISTSQSIYVKIRCVLP